MNNYVRNAVGFSILGNGVIVVLWEFGYDVPGVKKAREDTEETETDIDEGVGGAYATFNPNLGEN